jgi:hypothetical protein
VRAFLLPGHVLIKHGIEIANQRTLAAGLAPFTLGSEQIDDGS